jgi:ParB family chromosome partitioning protein
VRGRPAARPGRSTAIARSPPDLPVRSWGGEGLAKLGDLRALPVLSGTQRHDHRPLRIGAIVGFVALGPDGARGLRQGLEDRDREIQDLAFAVIVARDAALAAVGIAPDLLVDAMSSPSPEIRFAAARLFERRAAGEGMDADVIGEIVGPRRPEKATEMKDWPPPPRRAAILQVLADAIASDEPGQRYAATQVLAVRTQPLTFWREPLASPDRPRRAVPNQAFRSRSRVAQRSWLRRLVDGEARSGGDRAGGARRDSASRPSGPTGIDPPRTPGVRVYGLCAGADARRCRRLIACAATPSRACRARREAVGVEAVLPVRHALAIRIISCARGDGGVRSLYPPAHSPRSR